MIVAAISSAFSTTHFCARRRTFARPSKPSASHAGWAARARAASAATPAADVTATVAIRSPVAGFSTAIASRATTGSEIAIRVSP
jgi:hypothetical protein